MTESEPGFDSEESEKEFDCCYVDQYDCNEINKIFPKKVDPEEFEYLCITTSEDVRRVLNESVQTLCVRHKIVPYLAKMLLHTHKWSLEEVMQRCRLGIDEVLANSNIKPLLSVEMNSLPLGDSQLWECSICLDCALKDHFRNLFCGHFFCKDCWSCHFEIQINQGVTTAIECMEAECRILVPEDFVMSVLNDSPLREKYEQFAFTDYVKIHPEFKYCPGPNCNVVIRAKELKSKRVTCSSCNIQFCFRCIDDYHAPTTCEMIKKWLIKCSNDSETANYVTTKTKDCPNCQACIEKDGGCNHMCCYSCCYQFCWMCLGEWKTHVYTYDCSTYNKNPEQEHARAALDRYLFYFRRWQNHEQSRLLEEQTFQKIKDRMHQKLKEGEGSWIQWQYLLDAAHLLEKCRCTLQYTYPYAFFMEEGPQKGLFEYQQARLEKEIENLSWKVERAEITDRWDIENQVDIAEKRRITLLQDFLIE